VLVKFALPLAPLILGVILGAQIEVNLVRALMTDDNPWLFLTRPISGGMLVLSVVSVALAVPSCGSRQSRVSLVPPCAGTRCGSPPAPLTMIYVSVVAELLGGIGLLIPRTARPRRGR
jgi:hypothetical protein